MTVLKVKLLIDDEKLLPTKGTPYAAGWDLKASHDIIVFPNSMTIVHCGIAIEIESGYEAQVRSRSGLAKKNGCFVLNSPGTVDSDFRGELVVLLQNLGREAFFIKYGDRIAQLVIHKLPEVSIERVYSLSETERGSAGFGSTGIG